jgi:hypothetical protein
MAMTQCTACQRHFFARESRCPHCQAEGARSPLAAILRQAKMGGLLLFTAFTTTACYGTPAVMMPPGGRPNLATEQPLRKVPATAGKAYVFVSNSKGVVASRTIGLESTSVPGGTELSLVGMPGPSSFSLRIKAKDASVFAERQGVIAALPVEAMAELTLQASLAGVSASPSASGVPSPSESASAPEAPAPTTPPTVVSIAAPGSTPVQGQLQLSRSDADAIGGTLRLQSGDTLVEIYFLAERH